MCVSVSETTVFHPLLHSRRHPSEPTYAAIAHAPALPCSPPTPTGFPGNLYFRHKGASGSLLTALSKLTRRSTSPLTSALRRCPSNGPIQPDPAVHIPAYLSAAPGQSR